MSFWGELKRRDVFKVGAGHLPASWLIVPVFDDVRELPGFKAHLVDTRSVDSWRATEWPDVCRPTGGDFECG